jgi:GMP synthase-like glutamine amidotransferase
LTICFVDIEHDKVLHNPQRREPYLGSLMDIKLKLEEIAGAPCIVQRYTDVTRHRLERLAVEAILIGGNATEMDEYEDGAWTELHEIIRSARWPLLAICGGHHLVAMAHGAPIEPMRALRPGEPDVTTLSGPGYYKEWAFMPVNITQPDPLFAGLDPSPVFLEAHYWEVKDLEAGFEALAASDECAIQVMKQTGKPIYGTQFHPECFTEYPHDRRSRLVNLIYPEGHAEARPDGRTLLANFFRIAGIL